MVKNIGKNIGKFCGLFFIKDYNERDKIIL